MSEDPQSGEGAVVELNVPASSIYVATLRSVTSGLAARCDLTLDEIEDLRIAVDEACALLLPLAKVGADLRSTFTLGTGELTFRASVSARADAELMREGFGWTVLEALATTVKTEVDAATLTITLVKRREPADQ